MRRLKSGGDLPRKKHLPLLIFLFFFAFAYFAKNAFLKCSTFP
jgi:hypothetical protein